MPTRQLKRREWVLLGLVVLLLSRAGVALLLAGLVLVALLAGLP